jgi:iron-sulfur cluster repair protein YtfE (RIC family)
MSTSPHRTLTAALLSEHKRMQALLVSLVEQADADVRPGLQQTWAELESLLVAHMHEEESYLFPDLSRARADAVGSLEADHARIRRLVGEIGIGVELHIVRAATLHALADELRAHAAREDELLYPWAETAEAAGPRALSARKRRVRPSV